MLIVTLMSVRVGGSNVTRSVLTAGQIKQCFDLNIPCWFSSFREQTGETTSYSRIAYHLDMVRIDDSGEVPVYTFTAGGRSFTASSLDDPVSPSMS